MQLSVSESAVGWSEGMVPSVRAHRGDEGSLPVALLVVSTNSSGHDRRDKVLPTRGFFFICVCVSVCVEEGGSVSELADGSQNMKQCRGNVWWVRCTELQAREQAC